MPKILREFGENPELREAFIFSVWRKIAGESLSEHTVPVKLFGKHLVIAVADKMWKRHLELLSDQMIFKLNSALEQEAVTFVEFRIDENRLALERGQKRKDLLDDEKYRETILKQLTPKLRRSAESIKDDNLRLQFLLAAGGCLARKERLKTDPE